MNRQLEIKKGKGDKHSPISKLKRSELQELLIESKASLKKEAMLLLKEKERARSFEKVLINKNFRGYFKEVSENILIKDSSSIRIIFSKRDFFLQPFAIGHGIFSEDYSYLDNQIIDQLGGKSHLIIQDTSKIHNLKFNPKKNYPRSLIALPIIHEDLKVGCIWIGDKNYRAFSEEVIKEYENNIGEHQKIFTVLFKTLSTSQENSTLREIYDSIEDPILIINRQQLISQANPSAIKNFDLIPEENGSFSSEENNFIDRIITSAKIKIEKCDREFEIQSVNMNSNGAEGVRIYRFIDKTKEMAFNRYLSTIISIITQYIRTPITEVKGLAALIASLGDLSKKQLEFLKNMRTNLDLIEHRIQELMSIDRLNKSGFIELSEVMTDKCIDNAIITLAPLAEQKQITIKTDYDQKRKKILFDAALLNHALLNMLDFAIKGSHIGGIVEIKSVYEPNAFLISIKDFGKGISKLDINRMIDDRNIDQYPGGIKNTKNIMKLLNGDINIESNLGSGTSITMKFPYN